MQYKQGTNAKPNLLGPSGAFCLDDSRLFIAVMSEDEPFN